MPVISFKWITFLDTLLLQEEWKNDRHTYDSINDYNFMSKNFG